MGDDDEGCLAVLARLADRVDRHAVLGAERSDFRAEASRERGELRGFDHYGVARHQRRHELREIEHEREVPGRDQSGDAERLAAHEAPALRAEELVHAELVLPGVLLGALDVPEHVLDARVLLNGVGEHDRRADLGHDLRRAATGPIHRAKGRVECPSNGQRTGARHAGPTGSGGVGRSEPCATSQQFHVKRGAASLGPLQSPAGWMTTRRRGSVPSLDDVTPPAVATRSCIIFRS